MKRRDILRSFAVSPLIGRFALAFPPDSNAATLYREAVAKLPALSEAETVLTKNVAVTPLDGAAKALVDRAAPALDLLRQGAKASRCDWGGGWSGEGWMDKFWMQARSLARLASLRGRFAFIDRHPREGIDLAIASMTLGRHFGQFAALICQLIGFAIEHVAIDAAAPALPGLDRESLESFLSRFEALPEGVGLRAMIEAERAFFLDHVVPKDKAVYDDIKVEHLLAWFDRCALAANDPIATDAIRAASKGNAEEIKTLDSFDAYRLNAIPYVNVKRAMFRAAIAVVEDGPKAIDRVPDPTDGKPFDLRTWATGFELTSRFAPEGKPRASLVVGRR